MARNTRTWSDLIGLTNARMGKNLTGSDLTRLGFLLNSAARIIYEETPWWGRQLVLEPRTVERGYVSFSEDSYNVFGAGTTEANGLYVRNGSSVDGNPSYSMYDDDGTETHSIASTGNIAWAIQDVVTADILYSIGSSSTTPPETGWTVETDGDSPAPIVQALSDIGEYIGHWNGVKWECYGSERGFAYPDQNGIRVTDCSDVDTVYVAFKKDFNTQYGDGTAGTVSDIPSEWFDFMAYHAARSYRASQAQPDGYNPIALRDVQQVLDQALMKVSRQGIYDAIAKRFRTIYGTDVSVR